MLPGWTGLTVTRLRGTPVVDRWSTEPAELDWSAPNRLQLKAIAFAPTGSVEPLIEGRDPVESSTSLYLPAGVDVDALDRIEMHGEVWRVVGDPQRWDAPWTGAPVGLVVRMERVDG